MNQTDTPITLQSLVDRLSGDENLVLAAFLTLKSASQVESSIFQPPQPPRSLSFLKQAFELAIKLSKAERLALAIELLQNYQNGEEEVDDILDIEHFRDRRLDQ